MGRNVNGVNLQMWVTFLLLLLLLLLLHLLSGTNE